MIISHSNQFIGIKTRKAASSSIEIGLNRICSKEDYINWLREHRKAQKSLILTKANGLGQFEIKPHTSVYKLKEKAINQKLITYKQGDNYFKFTIERNPWDKVISLYYYRLTRKNVNITFEEFMKNGNGKVCFNWPLYTIGNKIKVDYIMRFENLQKEIEFLSKKIGKNIELLNENKFRTEEQKDYREYYNKENKKKVENTYKKEIDYFNYRF